MELYKNIWWESLKVSNLNWLLTPNFPCTWGSKETPDWSEPSLGFSYIAVMLASLKRLNAVCWHNKKVAFALGPLVLLKVLSAKLIFLLQIWLSQPLPFFICQNKLASFLTCGKAEFTYSICFSFRMTHCQGGRTFNSLKLPFIVVVCNIAHSFIWCKMNELVLFEKYQYLCFGKTDVWMFWRYC